MKSRILIFIAGALSGLAIAIYFGLGAPPEAVMDQVVACPQPPPPSAAPPAKCPAPLRSEDIRAAEERAEELKAEELLAKERRRLEAAPMPIVPDQAALQPPPVVPEPEPPQPPPTIAPEPPTSLLIPVEGILASQLKDTFTETRGGGRVHDAIDILAPKGTPVRAAADGRVVKLFKSVPGGLTVYQFDRSEKFAYYYAHLDGYAPDVAEGKQLKRGDLVGYVGHTGNAIASAPHLHFAIFVLGPQKRWWEGTAINPYPLLAGQQGSLDD